MMKNRGQRSWSVGLSVADITNSVLTDRKKTHSVTTLAQVSPRHLLTPSSQLQDKAGSCFCLASPSLQGWGGIGTEVFLSLPCIMGANGSTRLVGALLGPEEDARLRESVASLSDLMSQLRI